MTVEHRVMITLLTMALRIPPSVMAVAKLLHSKSKRRNSELDRSSDGFEEAQIASQNGSSWITHMMMRNT